MTYPLVIELRPSRSLVAFLLAGHIVAIIATASGLPALPAVMVSAALGLSLLGQLQSALLRRAGSIKALHIAADGLVRYRDRKGDWHRAELGDHAYASPWLVVLPLTDQSGTQRHAVLLADSAGKDDLRRLRAWLQWGQPARAHRDAQPR